MPAVSRAPALDVVVATRDTRELTLRCAEAVLGERTAGLDVHLIVVDNGSKDGTTDAIAERWPDVTVLRNDADAGYARACNQGVRAGVGEFVLILNSDAFPRPGALGRLVSFLAAHPNHSVAAGLLVDAGTDRPQVGFAVRGYPTLAAQVALLLGLEQLWPRNPLSRRQTLPNFDYSRTQNVEAQPAGACLACQRSDFEAIGGFDEGFHYWFEDVDLVLRLRARGRVAYVHDAVFDHVGGATFGQWQRSQVVRTRYRSLLLFFQKHHSPAAVLGLRAAIGTLAALRAVPLAIVAPGRARAYLDVLRLAVFG
jgi:GT2 family glycosyltransferase